MIAPTLNGNAKKHRHDGSIWIIAGGALLWCYQCGAFRPNSAGRVPGGWHKPSGIGGPNPAMRSIRDGGAPIAKESDK